MTETTATPFAADENQDRPTKLITRLDFRERLGGISDDKFFALIRDGEIEPPLKIGVASRWMESDAEKYIQKLAEARQAPKAPAGIRRHHEKLASQRAARVADAIERGRKAVAA